LENVSFYKFASTLKKYIFVNNSHSRNPTLGEVPIHSRPNLLDASSMFLELGY
jgi:hypothetical protein